jgi:hypothetical protein
MDLLPSCTDLMNARFDGPTSILHSTSFDGPWETTIAGFGSQVAMCPTCGDTNPAPFFRPDGSVGLLWRTVNAEPAGSCPAESCIAQASAPLWHGPYNWSSTGVFAGDAVVNRTHIEDAHVWRSPRGSANAGAYVLHLTED